MLLLCLTGLPLIFFHEIDHAMGRSVDPPETVAVRGPASLDSIVSDAQKRKPGDVVQFMGTSSDEPHSIFITMGETIDAPEASAFFTYDARTGEFVHEYPLKQGFMFTVFKLHVDLFADLPGMLFLGFMGLLLTISLVSGAVVYSPFMRNLPFGTVRRDRSVSLKWLDLHNLIGIGTLVWFLVVGVTGVINTLATPILDQWKETELASMIAPYMNDEPGTEPVSLERAVAAARAAEPEMELGFIAFPGNSFAGPYHFSAFMRGKTPLTSKIRTPLLIDTRSYEVVEKRELPLYVKAFLISQPLHFGDYGGLPLKILWAILDILAIIVLVSGIVLWYKGRRVPIEARLKIDQLAA